MSSNLGWEPADRNMKPLSDALKFAMRKKYGSFIHVVMDSGDVGYLEGLRDAGVEDAQKLLDAIEKHGRISVREE